MPLDEYNRKRDFSKTAEPKGAAPAGRGAKARPAARKARRFVVQEHHASRLHFDLRLEVDGVLKSWAVPKGPTLDPSVRRLAVLTEDHPLKYLTFEGHIPEGNYGAGDMAVWDTGTFETDGGDAAEEFKKGKLPLNLYGEKLQGHFTLVRTRTAGQEQGQWLLIKSKDEFAEPGWVLEQVIGEGSSDGGGKATAKKGRAVAEKKPAKKLVGSDAGAVDLARLDKLDGAKRAALPAEVKPMLATLVTAPPTGDWLYEIKWDGYRAVSFVEGGEARLISRNKIDLGGKFPELAGALAKIGVETAVFDGEIVVLDDKGRPSFQLLQNRAGLYSKRGQARKKPSGEPAVALYYAFDLLYLNGFDLKGVPLTERKRLLQALLGRLDAEVAATIRYSDHVSGVGSGASLLKHARELELEGIMAKQAESLYQERRSEKWQKIKLVQQTDVVICGYTAPRKTRAHFGALVIGVYREGKLEFVGHTGSGFNAKSLRETFELLQPLQTAKCPFAKKPLTNEPATWVKPELVCEVNFSEWTDDGSLRHPIFQGLRLDKDPKECVFEVPKAQGEVAKAASKAETTSKAQGKGEVASEDVTKALARKGLKGDLRVIADGHEVALTSLDKMYWPDEGYTKGDLLRYYASISEAILPYLKDRPLILERFPGGIAGKSFHQHNIESGPEFLETFTHVENGETIHYALCNNLASLLYVANLGTIAMHAWLSRIERVTNPDWIVFDLDPGEVEYRALCELALELKAILGELGIDCQAKTSGSAGLHVCVCVRPEHSFKQIEGFAALVAEIAVARRPDIATLERSLSKRPKKSIYLDHMQNREGKSMAAPWSARAKPGATVSTPLTWAEVKKVPDPAAFTILSVPARFRKKGDLFAEAARQPQNLEPVLKQLKNLSKRG